MKLQIIVKHILIQVLLFGTLWLGYAAWNTTVTDGSTLTATLWNDLVWQVSTNTSKLSNFVFPWSGDVTVSWNISASTPTASWHLTTKWYVDGVVSSGWDNLWNHTATQTINTAGNWINGASWNAGINVNSNWAVRIDTADATYDVWIQWGAATSGWARNLAILWTDEDSGDALYINHGWEYAGGTFVWWTDLWVQRYRDSWSSNYYLDPNSVSYLNDIRPHIIYDRDNTSYYLNPNSTSRLNYTVFDSAYSYTGWKGWSCHLYFRFHANGAWWAWWAVPLTGYNSGISSSIGYDSTYYYSCNGWCGLEMYVWSCN